MVFAQCPSVYLKSILTTTWAPLPHTFSCFFLIKHGTYTRNIISQLRVCKHICMYIGRSSVSLKQTPWYWLEKTTALRSVLAGRWTILSRSSYLWRPLQALRYWYTIIKLNHPTSFADRVHVDVICGHPVIQYDAVTGYEWEGTRIVAQEMATIWNEPFCRHGANIWGRNLLGNEVSNIGFIMIHVSAKGPLVQRPRDTQV